MNIEIFIVNIIISIFMSLQMRFYFDAIFDKPPHTIPTVICTCMSVLLNTVYLSFYFSPIPSSILSLASIFAFSLCYRKKLFTKLVFCLVYVILISILNFVSVFILYRINFIPTDIILDYVNKTNYMQFSKVIFFSLLFMFPIIHIIRFFIKKHSDNINSRYYILLLSISLLSLFQVNVLNSYGIKNIYYFLSIIGTLFLNVFIIYTLDRNIQRLQLENHNTKLQLQMDYQDASYEKTVHAFKDIKRIIHDTNQQFLYIEECIKNMEYEEASRHIKTTLNKVETYYPKINTGNLAIDALVSNAVTLCASNGITIDTIIQIQPEQIAIERYDLCVVLGNMLDNAIEYSKRVKVAQDRHIRVKIGVANNNLLITVSNFIEDKIESFQTRKDNAGFHGIGLLNISNICDKYGGNMTTESIGSTFHNMVIIPFALKQ